MNKKKNFIFIFVLILFSIVVAFAIELFWFNRKNLFKNNISSIDIVEKKDIINTNGWYETTSNNSYVILKLKDSYINKINFDYKYNKNFSWYLEYNTKNNVKIKSPQTSSFLINRAVRKLNTNTSTIKIVFLEKNIKFRNIMQNNLISFNFGRILFLVVLISVFLILLKFKEYFISNLDKLFLLIVLPCSFLFVFIMSKTVYVSWDDQIHYKNSYALFDKNSTKSSEAMTILLDSSYTDSKLYQSIEEKFMLYKYINELDKNTYGKSIQLNDYSEKYSKIVYLPMYIGFKIAKLFNFDFILSFTFAKILNLLCYVILMYFAIKISTYAKKIVFIIALFISNIFLATQFSYDPTIIAGITLGLASFLRILEMKTIDYKYIIIFIFSIVWACLPKAIYAPILLLLLFIPNSKFKNKETGIKLKILVSVIFLLLISTFVLPALFTNMAGDDRGGNTSVARQMAYIINNPIQYIKTFGRFFFIYSPRLLIGPNTFTGTGYVIPTFSENVNLFYISYLLMIFYYVFSSKLNKNVITKRIKIIFLILIFGLFILISTALYLSFSPVGSNEIFGVQTRYFIPLFLPLLIVLWPTSSNVKNDNLQNDSILVFLPFLLLMLFVAILIYHTIGI